MNRFTMAAATIGVALASAIHTSPLAGQEAFPLGPRPTAGLSVGPMFEGWWANPDGSYTLSFGYYNPNAREVIDVPLGPDNRIEPAEFDGVQPTHFPPVVYGGYDGRRERGTFAITIPAEYVDQDVVWSIRSNGRTEKVIGRVGSQAYELTHEPMAMGSRPPRVSFASGGPYGIGPSGVFAERQLSTRVNQPIELTVTADDALSDREEGSVPLGVTWRKHQGPGDVTFEPRSGTIPSGVQETVSTTASFSAPGEYIVRVRVDNFRAADSAHGDQCCWTNGYIRVNVTE